MVGAALVGQDMLWGVNLTALHLALEQGQWLLARQLLAQGEEPQHDTERLVRLQDHPASHLLARETGLAVPWLPGSACPALVRRLSAEERADAMSLAWVGTNEGTGEATEFRRRL